MDSPNTQASVPVLPEGRFTGRTDFSELIRLAFRAAAAQGWREIVVCDASFEDSPWGERVVTDALGA